MGSGSWYTDQYNALQNAANYQRQQENAAYYDYVNQRSAEIKADALASMAEKEARNRAYFAEQAASNAQMQAWQDARNAQLKANIEAKYATIEIPIGNERVVASRLDTNAGGQIARYSAPAPNTASGAQTASAMKSAQVIEATFTPVASGSTIPASKASPVIPPDLVSAGKNIGLGIANLGVGTAGNFAGSGLANALTGNQGEGDYAKAGAFLGSLIGGGLGGTASGAATFGVGTFGGSLIGTAIGSTVGSFLGGLLDNAFGKKPTNTNLSRSANTSGATTPTIVGGQSVGVAYNILVEATFANGAKEYSYGANPAATVSSLQPQRTQYVGPISTFSWSPEGNSANYFINGAISSYFFQLGLKPAITSIQIIGITRADGQPDTGGNLGGADNSGKPYIPSALAPPLPVEYTGNPNLVGFSDRDGEDFSKFGRWDPPPVAKPNGVPNAYKPVGEKAPPAANPTPAKNGSPNPTASGNPTANNDPKSPTRASDFAFSGVGNPEIPQSQPIPSSSPATKIPVNPTGTSTPTPSPDALQVIGAVTAVGATVAALKVGSDILVNNSLSNTAKIDQIANNTTPTAQQTNAKQGVCDAMQPSQCGFEGVKAATTEATNPIKDIANDNKSVLASILGNLGALATLIVTNFTKLFNFLDINAKVEAVKSTITLALTIHNALMLSQSLGDTLGLIIDNVLNIFGNTFRSTDGTQISASQYLGASVKQWIINVIGVENYVKLNDVFATANRIYQTGMNVLSTVQSILDSAASVAQATGINVAKIGNALRDESVVSPRAYTHMDDTALGNRPTTLSRFTALTTTVSDLDTKAQNLVTITAAPIQIKDAVKQSKDDIKAFNEARDTNSKAAKEARDAKLEEIKQLKPITEATVGKRDDDT